MENEEKSELSTICRQLKLPSSDGKEYQTDCANVEVAIAVGYRVNSKQATKFRQ